MGRGGQSSLCVCVCVSQLVPVCEAPFITATHQQYVQTQICPHVCALRHRQGMSDTAVLAYLLAYLLQYRDISKRVGVPLGSRKLFTGWPPIGTDDAGAGICVHMGLVSCLRRELHAVMHHTGWGTFVSQGMFMGRTLQYS